MFLKEPSPSTLWSLWATWKVVHQARHIPHQLPLSQAWGVGCSPRPMAGAFPSRARPAMPAACPRLWAMAMGVTFYSWSSDQLSQYGTRFVPVTVRDSTYVLDEICTNETELPIREHTTDTAGATEIIFARFDLPGYRFAPRLRDLNDRRLFASGPVDIQRYPSRCPSPLRIRSLSAGSGDLRCAYRERLLQAITHAIKIW